VLKPVIALFTGAIFWYEFHQSESGPCRWGKPSNLSII